MYSSKVKKKNKDPLYSINWFWSKGYKTKVQIQIMYILAIKIQCYLIDYYDSNLEISDNELKIIFLKSLRNKSSLFNDNHQMT